MPLKLASVARDGALAEGLGSAAAALAAASMAPNTRSAYQVGLRRLAREGFTADAMSDTALANALAGMADAGASPSSCSVAAAAAAKAAALLGQPSPRGPKTAAVMAGISRTHSGRGRGQSDPITVEAAAAIAATARIPRTSGRGRESAAAAERRGLEDTAITGLLFHGGMRRSEVVSLEWRDVRDAPNVPGALLVEVRTSKSNPDGKRRDVRMVKGPFAAAIRSLRPGGDKADPRAKVLSVRHPETVSRRIAAAAKAAGVDGRITGHSGRIGLASELVSRGASTAAVMLAGGWRSAEMVTRYAAGAKAEQSAVAELL